MTINNDGETTPGRLLQNVARRLELSLTLLQTFKKMEKGIREARVRELENLKRMAYTLRPVSYRLETDAKAAASAGDLNTATHLAALIVACRSLERALERKSIGF